MRLLRWAGLTFAAGFILVLLVSTVGKTVLENYAQSEARAFAVSAGDDTSLPVPERVRRVAAAVYKFYSQRDLSSPSLLFRLQPYLTNQVLPGFFRVQSGAIETILIEGACDSASRASVFILRQLGIDATQVNLITPHNGHSIVGVNLDDGSQILLDPTYGLAPLRHGSLLTTAETLALHRMQVPAGTIWATIADGATYHPIYDDFASAALASQGEPLHWTVHIWIWASPMDCAWARPTAIPRMCPKTVQQPGCPPICTISATGSIAVGFGAFGPHRTSLSPSIPSANRTTAP